MDILTLSQSKSYANLVALGLTDVTINGSTVTFALNDGEIASITFPTPSDGKSLEFDWNGTQLGIRQEGETTYTYVNLQGEKGDPGEKGEKGDSGESTLIIDNLSSTSSSAALSANQGKVLNEKIKSTLTSLNDVNINDVTDKQALIFDSTTSKWINGNVSGGTTINELNDVGDVNILSPISGQVLKYNSTSKSWVNSEQSTGNWLDGKTINFIGDSLTYGYDGTTAGRLENPYPALVAEILNCTANNYGISGSTLSNGTNSSDPIVDRLSSLDTSADIVFLLGGGNDYLKGKTLGDKDSTDKTTIYGALESIATTLLAKFPKSIIVFCGTLKISSSITSTSAYTLQDVVTAVKYVAQKYSFQYLDLYNTAPMFDPSNTKWCSDGVHPNQDYISLVFSHFIAEKLLSCTSDIADNAHSVYVGATTPIDTGVQLFIDTSRTLSSADAVSIDYNAGVFSSTEAPVGQWIDGSKIYRKVFTLSSISGCSDTADKQFDISFSTPTKLINLYGIYEALQDTDDCVCGNISQYWSSTLYGNLVYLPKKDIIRLTLMQSLWNGATINIVIDYLK